jgi:hypothetical protein
MSAFDLDHFQHLLGATRSAGTPDAKGKSLELLVTYLLDAVPGIRVIASDVRTQAEEVDIVAHNQREDPAFRDCDPVIFVECKNWSQAVGKAELTDFLSDLRTRGLRFGRLVTCSGITGTRAGTEPPRWCSVRRCATDFESLR